MRPHWSVALVDAGLIAVNDQNDRRKLAAVLSRVIEIITADLPAFMSRVTAAAVLAVLAPISDHWRSDAMTIMQQIGRVSASLEVATRSDEFVNLAKSLMLGHGNASAAAQYAASPRLAQILKGAVASGEATSSTWAEQIAQHQTIAASFISGLKGFGAFDAMFDSFIQLPPHVRAVCITLGATTGSTPGETQPIPIDKLEVSASTLKPRTSFVMPVMSEEWLKIAPAAATDTLNRKLRSIARVVDESFLTSITDDTNVASNAATNDFFADDIVEALRAMDTGADFKIFVVLPPSLLKTITLRGTLFGTAWQPSLTITGGVAAGVAFVPSDALTDSVIVIDAAQVVAFSGAVDARRLERSCTATVRRSNCGGRQFDELVAK